MRPHTEQDMRARFAEHCEQYGIPAYMRGGLSRYVFDHIPPGSFLQAVLENDLRAAVERADHINQQLLPQYVKLLYNHAPMSCWGDPERVAAWLKPGGVA